MLIVSYEHNSAGEIEQTTDPAGTISFASYDAVGREIERILNYQESSNSSSNSFAGGCGTSDDVNITVRTAYNADGNVASITAVNSLTGDQTTEYIYGSTLTDSDIAASTLKRAEVYPDSTDSDARIEYKYNRQSQIKESQDQQGTVHAFDHDKMGRVTQDRITTLGSGVDGAVRRLATTYEVRGMREKITSYDNATVGSGSVVNECQFAYNDFGQLIADYQQHDGAVNTSTSPKVEYGYASGAANTIPPTSITYPEGREITFDYGAADSASDALSRVEAIVDDDMSSTHLADCSYLGLNTFIEVDYTEPDIKYTLVGVEGGNDPDTGDIYLGLDRFGRIKDSRWYDYGGSADVDRIKHGYDRSGNRLWRENVVAASNSKDLDELYEYDLINRLLTIDRGDLSSLKDSISNLQFAQEWSLDAVGNWRNFCEDSDGDSTWDLEQERDFNKVNEITDITETTGPSWVTPAYNKAGNMTTIPQPSDPISSYTATYDAWNRLVNVVSGAKYEYDGGKRRTLKKVYDGGVLDETRHFYYTDPSRWQITEERVDTDTDPNRQFIWGLRYVDDLILRDRDTTGDGALDERLYALQDANWNVTALVDENGAVQERYAYSAYGVSITLTAIFGARASSSFDWEIRFAGYRWDRASGLNHVRHRWLHAELGKWCSRDPILLNAGDPNLYRYALGAPHGVVDPMGEIPLWVIVVVEGILLLVLISSSGCQRSSIRRKVPPPTRGKKKRFVENPSQQCPTFGIRWLGVGLISGEFQPLFR